MKSRLILLFIAGAIAAPILVAAHPRPVTFDMHALNGSNENGTATIAKTSGGKLLVTITLRNEPAGVQQAAHIHPGTCAKINPVPNTKLNPVVNGKSKTTIPSSATPPTGSRTIVVHNAAMNGYVACGDIPSR